MLSIDIGSQKIKIINATVREKQIIVNESLVLDTPPDTVYNGVVVNFEKISQIIGQAVAQYKWNGKKTAVVITSPDTIIREIKLPKTSAKNVMTIVANEMDAFLSGENYSIEFFRQNQEEGILKAHAFAMPSKTVSDYKKMISTAGLNPAVLDIGANCIRKLMTYVGNIKDESDVIVVTDIGFNFINFNLFSKNNLIYTRCIKIESESKLKSYIMSLEGKPSGELLADSNFVAYITDIGDEIQKILQFLASSDYRNSRAYVSICGGFANFNGIREWLQEYLNVQVSIMDEEIHTGVSGATLKEYVNAIGAQIRV